VDDLPVIIQDRDFKRNGSFAYLGSMMDSMRGMKGKQWADEDRHRLWQAASSRASVVW
jgi:hypothetical protein